MKKYLLYADPVCLFVIFPADALCVLVAIFSLFVVLGGSRDYIGGFFRLFSLDLVDEFHGLLGRPWPFAFAGPTALLFSLTEGSPASGAFRYFSE